MNELADGVSATDMPLVQMRGITKSFPGVDALRDVDLDLYAGEVLALLGKNGAGKSTLIKILGGAHAPDQGSLQVHGASEVIAGPTADDPRIKQDGPARSSDLECRRPLEDQP